MKKKRVDLGGDVVFFPFSFQFLFSLVMIDVSDGLRWYRRRFKRTLGNVRLHQMVEKNLTASAHRVEASDGPVGAEGLVGRFVQQVAVLAAAVRLETARERDDRRHLFCFVLRDFSLKIDPDQDHQQN